MIDLRTRHSAFGEHSRKQAVDLGRPATFWGDTNGSPHTICLILKVINQMKNLLDKICSAFLPCQISHCNVLEGEI